MSTRIFISRPLENDSIFRQRLQQIGYEVQGFSLVTFQAVNLTKIPACDWVFFYSKKAISFFFAQAFSLDPAIQLATFGPGTAQALRAQGQPVHFTGDGTGASTARAFAALAKGQRVLFPRALHSQQSIQKRLREHIEVIDLVVYHNQPRLEFPQIDAKALVFTSPMNAQAYFAQYALKEQQWVFAIGPTTAKALQQLGIRPVYVAAQPSEAALVEIILAQDAFKGIDES